MKRLSWEHGFTLVAVALVAVGVVSLGSLFHSHRLAGFSTSLSERSSEQLYNITRAAKLIDGTVIEPRRKWSFNRAAGPYDHTHGYVPAPAIIAGEVRLSPGGGVCQLSSTLYNAALLAGLKIVERHPHLWPVRSVPPGRDAMVAQDSADLVLRNPWPTGVTISARLSGEQLIISLWGRQRESRPVAVRVEQQRIAPASITRVDPCLVPGSQRMQPGRPGYHCTVWRTIGMRRELVSDDLYQARNAVRWVSR